MRRKISKSVCSSAQDKELTALGAVTSKGVLPWGGGEDTSKGRGEGESFA